MYSIFADQLKTVMCAHSVRYYLIQVASRRVVQTSALIMITCGVVGKFGAVFVNIPEPIVGGVFIVMFGEVSDTR